MQDDNKKNNVEDLDPVLWDLFEYEKISGHLLIRAIWALILRFAFKFFIRLKVKGSFKQFYKKYPKLIIISNHTSHLDGPAILAAIPFAYWMDLYILAAKDYWFSSWYLRLFSKYFLGAIPVERKRRSSESAQQCINLLQNLKKIWMVIFPEGTRSKDGSLQPFKKGVSLFSQKTNTPVLFLYLRGNRRLWPKEKNWPAPGKIHLYVGPIQEPCDIDTLFSNYKEWIDTIESSLKKRKLRYANKESTNPG